jgi:hypothetical protein
MHHLFDYFHDEGIAAGHTGRFTQSEARTVFACSRAGFGVQGSNPTVVMGICVCLFCYVGPIPHPGSRTNRV